MEDKKISKVKPAEVAPSDWYLSIHINNLFQTFGEDKVRKTMKDLFGMESKPKKVD